jgi:bifunctional non-homologous end joining protein LigD
MRRRLHFEWNASKLMLPQNLHPMLAKKASAPFDSAQHIFELKWDGIRSLAFIEDNRVRLLSRRGLEITFQFPELACLGGLPTGTVLDGELVVLHQGKPSLRHVLRRALLQKHHRFQLDSALSSRVSYMVFDLLYLKGKPLLGLLLRQRREALQRLFQQFPMPGVLLTEVVRQHGRKLFEQVESMELEGVMAKRLDGPYLPGKRSAQWLKIKTRFAGRQIPRQLVNEIDL